MRDTGDIHAIFRGRGDSDRLRCFVTLNGNRVNCVGFRVFDAMEAREIGRGLRKSDRKSLGMLFNGCAAATISARGHVTLGVRLRGGFLWHPHGGFCDERDGLVAELPTTAKSEVAVEASTEEEQALEESSEPAPAPEVATPADAVAATTTDDSGADPEKPAEPDPLASLQASAGPAASAAFSVSPMGARRIGSAGSGGGTPASREDLLSAPVSSSPNRLPPLRGLAPRSSSNTSESPQAALVGGSRLPPLRGSPAVLAPQARIDHGEECPRASTTDAASS